MLYISSSDFIHVITTRLSFFTGMVSEALFWGLTRVHFGGTSFGKDLWASTVILVPPSPLVHVPSLLLLLETYLL